MPIYGVQHQQWSLFGPRIALTNVVGHPTIVDRMLGSKIRPTRFEYLLVTPFGGDEKEIRADKVVFILDDSGQLVHIVSRADVPTTFHVGCLRHRKLLHLEPTSPFWKRETIWFAAENVDVLVGKLQTHILAGDVIDVTLASTTRIDADTDNHIYVFA